MNKLKHTNKRPLDAECIGGMKHLILEEKLEGKRIIIGPCVWLNHHEILASPCATNWIIKRENKISQLKEKLELSQKENKKMRKCVEFYACEDQWDGPYLSGDSEFIEIKDGAGYHLNGKRARQCLKELESGE